LDNIMMNSSELGGLSPSSSSLPSSTLSATA
jgi:hypothetical protein